MKALTFLGGIHPNYNKTLSLSKPLLRAALPDKVIVPLSQHIGTPNQPIVNKGDYVEEGQVIGTCDAFVSSPCHAPISGTVTGIQKGFHPVLGPVTSVAIERDKTKGPKEYVRKDRPRPTKEELIKIVRGAGICGMGGASFPTHVKLSVPEGKKIDTLIVNGAECEPFLTCDHALMDAKPEEMLIGLDLVIDIIKPKTVYIGLEDNKMPVYYKLEECIKKSKSENISKIKLALLETKYPQGGEKQLIKSITGDEVPPRKLPMDIGYLIQNTGSLYAIYEAVYMEKPLIERVITISGDCMEKPGNYLFKLGTTVGDIMRNYGLGFYKDPKKIIFGGPMMGFSQPGFETPVLKGTSGILFFSDQYTEDYDEEACIKCAKCVDICPVNLSPTEIMKNTKKHNTAKLDKFLWVMDCIECGCCSFVCPARIPLVQYIKEGKGYVRKSRV